MNERVDAPELYNCAVRAGRHRGVPRCAAAVACVCVSSFALSARQLQLHVCDKKKAINALLLPILKKQTTTTTAIMMLTTTTNTNINTNISTTAQQRKKRTPEEQEKLLRDCWWIRVNGALFKRMKRNALAANALFGTPEWVEPDMRYFTASEEREVTRHAALVE